MEEPWLPSAATLGLSSQVLTRMMGHVDTHVVFPRTGLAIDCFVTPNVMVLGGGAFGR